jgi:hypothetical protein
MRAAAVTTPAAPPRLAGSGLKKNAHAVKLIEAE